VTAAAEKNFMMLPAQKFCEAETYKKCCIFLGMWEKGRPKVGGVGWWGDWVCLCMCLFCHFRYLSLCCWFIGAQFYVSRNETKAATATTRQKSTHKLEMAHFCNLVKRPIKRSQNAGKLCHAP